MLRLVDVNDSKPVSFPVDLDNSFEAGQLAQLKAVGEVIVCGISNGMAPFGIIDDTNTPNMSTVKKSKRITVWTKGIFETDQYDTSQLYKEDSILYCNRYGRLTSHKSSDNQVPVATLVKVPCSCQPNIWFKWI